MNTKTNHLKSKRNASVLVLVVFALVVFAIAGIGLLRLGLDSRVFAIRNATVIAARSAADAGLAKAVYDMNRKLQDPPWDDGDLPSASGQTLPNANATFSYLVSALPSEPGTLSRSYAIQSTGHAGLASRTVYSTARLRGLAEYAVFVRENLILKSGTFVGGFNSTDSTDTDINVQIGTNSTDSDSIILNSGVTVDGDVFIGIDGDVETVIKDLGATITGGAYAQSEETFITVTPPMLPAKGSLSVSGKTVQINQDDSGMYSAITLKGGKEGAKLEVASGDVVLHVTGDTHLGQGCEIIVKNGASLTLYLNGDLVSGSNSGFVNENTPPNIKLYGIAEVSQKFEIKAKSEYFGQIYAPNADIVIKADSDLYGAFVASSFEMKAGGNLYYDEALADVTPGDPGARFIIDHWYE